MRSLPVLLLLITGIFAAVSPPNAAGAADSDLDGRTFVSVAVDGEQIPGGGPLTVGFEDGSISAYAGCNRGFGPVDLAGGVLTARLGITMMACPPPLDSADRWMTDLLEARPRWTLTGDTLTLITDALTVTLHDRDR